MVNQEDGPTVCRTEFIPLSSVDRSDITVRDSNDRASEPSRAKQSMPRTATLGRAADIVNQFDGSRSIHDNRGRDAYCPFDWLFYHNPCL
jgi:hypothetical protein